MLIRLSDIEYTVMHADLPSFVAFCAGNQEGHFRLVNGSSPNEGRVEVCMNGGWRPVCDSGHNDTALAASVCSVLGYSEEGKVAIFTTTS